MYLSKQRDAFQMDLSLSYRCRVRGVKNDAVSVPDMQMIASDLLASQNEFLTAYGRGNQVLYVRDKRIEELKGKKFLILLLALSDRSRPDNVLSDPENKVRKELQKEDKEGNEHSCHLVVSIRPNMENGRRFRVAIESVPFFTVTYVQRYLRYVLRKLSQDRNYSISHPDGVKDEKTGDFMRILASVAGEMTAVPSDELLQDLQEGAIGQFELSKEIPGKRRFDEKGYTDNVVQKKILKPVRPIGVGDVMDAIRSVCSKADLEGYNVARVSWKTGKQSKSAKFDCHTTGILENRYIKSMCMDLDESLPTSCLSISDSLSGKMLRWICP